MSYTYSYQRNKTNNCYDLENIVTMDGDIVQSILPSDEIKTALPGKKFKLFGDDTIFRCVFEKELNADEKLLLDGIVNNSRRA